MDLVGFDNYLIAVQRKRQLIKFTLNRNLMSLFDLLYKTIESKLFESTG